MLESEVRESNHREAQLVSQLDGLNHRVRVWTKPFILKETLLTEHRQILDKLGLGFDTPTEEGVVYHCGKSSTMFFSAISRENYEFGQSGNTAVENKNSTVETQSTRVSVSNSEVENLRVDKLQVQ